MSNKINLDKKATDYLKDTIGGGGSGADVEFVITVNKEDPASSTLTYTGSKQQLKDKILAGKTISVQCLFRTHYTGVEGGLDWNNIGILEQNMVWLDYDALYADFTFTLLGGNTAPGTYIINWWNDEPRISAYVPKNNIS